MTYLCISSAQALNLDRNNDNEARASEIIFDCSQSVGQKSLITAFALNKAIGRIQLLAVVLNIDQKCDFG